MLKKQENKKKIMFPPMEEDLCRALILESPFCAELKHPSITTQSFLDWLSDNVDQAFKTNTDKMLFMEQLNSLRADEKEWQTFNNKWTLWMIFLDQNFKDVWLEICLHLCIPVFA